MSANQRHALGLISKLKGLTNAGVVAAAKYSLEVAIRSTVHDSSQAASNWKFSVNNAYERQRFLYREGRAPVGSRGDAGTNAKNVETSKVSELTQALGAFPEGGITSVLIYHPLPMGGKYARHAGIEKAAVMAGNAGVLDAVVAAAMRKHKSGVI